MRKRKKRLKAREYPGRARRRTRGAIRWFASPQGTALLIAIQTLLMLLELFR